MIYKFKQIFRKYRVERFGKCAVLLYHKVDDKNYDYFNLSVSIKNFDAQIKFLKQNYHILNHQEFHDFLDEKISIPKNSVFITFDDGYKNNYINALPILEKHKVHALFYISTGNISTNRLFWWDVLEKIFVEKKFALPKFENTLLNEFFIYNEYSNLAINNQLDYFRSKILKLEFSLRDIIIFKLLEETNVELLNNQSLDFLMSEDEIINFSKSEFVSIGAHTINHPFLSSENLDIQFKEIYNSKLQLEHMLNKKIVDFSFPYGTSDSFLNKTRLLSNIIGFKYVASNEPGLVNRCIDKYSFPRFVITNTEINIFKDKINSFFK
jgi:peptidoglycan/xylan/chitin deacetylase (PgdA/CDA1 family)